MAILARVGGVGSRVTRRVRAVVVRVRNLFVALIQGVTDGVRDPEDWGQVRSLAARAPDVAGSDESRLKRVSVA
ncbi:hypothetical protein AOE01nite_04970 [Acetobacter oeni]|uniref:Uncharacterized protein n=1 Tax=Acetobacter oeni TaxID=304077 RepID=A0A511XH49_9PROT|nr:hypothetical protein [Acetobacter oeni]GEN62273.1 hypothetical protein AOE01nite_04970 [Acetobacter oeni]